MLMMEYIDGIPIDALDLLKILGYDLNEIGRKLAENYVKQVLEENKAQRHIRGGIATRKKYKGE